MFLEIKGDVINTNNVTYIETTIGKGVNYCAIYVHCINGTYSIPVENEQEIKEILLKFKEINTEK